MILPKFLYAIETYSSGTWVQLDAVTPHLDVALQAERPMTNLRDRFGHMQKTRIVTYKRIPPKSSSSKVKKGPKS